MSDIVIAARPEHDISVWEDQREVSAGSVSMSISNSNSDSDSEDGMFGQPRSTYKIANNFSQRDIQTGQDR